MSEGFFSKLVSGLTKTRDTITKRVEDLINFSSAIDDDLYEELEEILITSDIGVTTTTRIVDTLKAKVKENKVKDPSEVKYLLKEILNEMLQKGDEAVLEVRTPCVIMIVGVNGVGKTTSIGKLANKYKTQGYKVLIAAGDTFRAAAIDQLNVWGSRAGVDVIKQQEGSDPAAVVFDAVQSAKSKKVDILICDTAGRLHNKKNLMEELKKVDRVISREYPESSRLTFLVLDATTGQNAVLQAKEFKNVCDINGIILTKLDGTAKGGIVIAIKEELSVPVRFIGVGEGMEDLQEFNSKDFVEALF
ncbi:signal recognition particle receptor FtsY [Oxobacter pfennigii]|uniref:Signal recognition particle receptor FtsY n=1 Tax=Oxobacter pfennigii TaxID=36849 RepID=A0A0P9AF05_9CLOT|nr:signal recognition particle-docking protein FtsY [Oxobacter pfennigii]KPU43937.1 signal recognition particle receptor FtsY [Oxobacter pfennigii]